MWRRQSTCEHAPAMTSRLFFGSSLVVFLLVACGGGSGGEAKAPKKDSIEAVCQTAEAISVGTRLSAATDDTAPRFAVKVRGPGELALAGFLHVHNVSIIEMGSKQTVARTTARTCAASYVPLPTESGGYGEYCVVFEPIEVKGWSTFDLDFSKEPHPRSPEASEKACGN